MTRHLGIDVGGTTTEAVVITGTGELLSRARRATNAHGPQAVLASALAVTGEVARSEGTFASAGLVIPGQVDPTSGTVRLAVNLGIGDEPFAVGPALSEALGGVPVAVENDVRGAAFGAYRHLKRDEPALSHLAYLSVGTGISAGVVLNGEIHRGRLGMAGEIGHTIVEPGGARCRCGLSGCLEAVAAGPAITAIWPSAERSNAATDLLAAADRGDHRAIAASRRVVGALVRAVHSLVMAYGAERVALGGGVASAGNALASRLRDGLDTIAHQSSVAAMMLPADLLCLMPPSHPTGALGAAALSVRGIGRREPMEPRARA